MILDNVARHPAPRLRGAAAREGRPSPAVAHRACEQARTPMIGRSHGIFAEPVTMGWRSCVASRGDRGRGRVRLSHAKAEIAVGKIAGAVGTYAHLTPQIEAEVGWPRPRRCRRRSWRAIATPRSSRRWRSSPRGSSGSPPTCGTGGSAGGRRGRGGVHRGPGRAPCPHKRNPIVSENLCGLARIVRAAVAGALERGALARARHLASVRRADDRSRHDRDPRLHAGARHGPRHGARGLPRGAVTQPGTSRRAVLLRGGAACAGRGRDAATGGLQARPAQRDARVVRRRHLPRKPARRHRGHGEAGELPGQVSASTSTTPSPTSRRSSSARSVSGDLEHLMEERHLVAGLLDALRHRLPAPCPARVSG